MNFKKSKIHCQLQDSAEENKDLNKRKDISCLWIEKFNIAKILPKIIDIFTEDPIKTQPHLFVEIDKLTLKFILKCKGGNDTKKEEPQFVILNWML